MKTAVFTICTLLAASVELTHALTFLSDSEMSSIRGAQTNCHQACTKAAACTDRPCDLVGQEPVTVLGIKKTIWYFVKYVKVRESRLMCDRSATPSDPPCKNDKQVVCTTAYDYQVVTAEGAPRPTNGCSGTGNGDDGKVPTCATY